MFCPPQHVCSLAHFLLLVGRKRLLTALNKEAALITNFNAAQVDVQVALAATAPVQGVYRCRLTASVAGPAAVKDLQHEYEAAGPIEPPLATSNLR